MHSRRHRPGQSTQTELTQGGDCGIQPADKFSDRGRTGQGQQRPVGQAEGDFTWGKAGCILFGHHADQAEPTMAVQHGLERGGDLVPPVGEQGDSALATPGTRIKKAGTFLLEVDAGLPGNRFPSWEPFAPSTDWRVWFSVRCDYTGLLVTILVATEPSACRQVAISQTACRRLLIVGSSQTTPPDCQPA